MSKVESNNKIASTDYNIHPLIKKRWSTRAFSDEPIPPELLRQLFDAARWAPSSFNEQPWRFIVATKDHPEEYNRISEVLNEKNKRWATRAPVLILTLKKDHFDKNSKTNKHAAHDLGQAVSYMTFEATRHDIYIHQLAGILPEEAIELFNIPDHFTPMTMIALGYRGDIADLPEKLQKSEQKQRSRLGIDEIVFRGTWDEPERLQLNRT